MAAIGRTGLRIAKFATIRGYTGPSWPRSLREYHNKQEQSQPFLRLEIRQLVEVRGNGRSLMSTPFRSAEVLPSAEQWSVCAKCHAHSPFTGASHWSSPSHPRLTFNHRRALCNWKAAGLQPTHPTHQGQSTNVGGSFQQAVILLMAATPVNCPGRTAGESGPDLGFVGQFRAPVGRERGFRHVEGGRHVPVDRHVGQFVAVLDEHSDFIRREGIEVGADIGDDLFREVGAVAAAWRFTIVVRRR
jgi:hypothetical protein